MLEGHSLFVVHGAGGEDDAELLPRQWGGRVTDGEDSEDGEDGEDGEGDDGREGGEGGEGGEDD